MEYVRSDVAVSAPCCIMGSSNDLVVSIYGYPGFDEVHMMIVSSLDLQRYWTYTDDIRELHIREKEGHGLTDNRHLCIWAQKSYRQTGTTWVL